MSLFRKKPKKDLRRNLTTMGNRRREMTLVKNPLYYIVHITMISEKKYEVRVDSKTKATKLRNKIIKELDKAMLNRMMLHLTANNLDIFVNPFNIQEIHVETIFGETFVPMEENGN